MWQGITAVSENRSRQQDTSGNSSRVKFDQSFTRETISTSQKHSILNFKVSRALSTARVKKTKPVFSNK